MAVRLKLDVKGIGRARKNEKGVELTRGAVAIGVPGSGAQRLVNALQVEGLPAIGSRHPADNSLVLREITPEEGEGGSIQYQLVYRDSDDSGGSGGEVSGYVQIEGGSEASQVETDHDLDGNKITLRYTYPSETKTPSEDNPAVLEDNPDYPWSKIEMAGKPDKKAGTVTVERSERYIRFTRLEMKAPVDVQNAYEDTINNANWNVFPTDPAGWWKCTSITYTANQGGASWNVTYVFKRRKGGWDPWARYQNFEGKVPSNLVDGTGKKQVREYVYANFTALGFPQVGPNPPKRWV